MRTLLNLTNTHIEHLTFLKVKILLREPTRRGISPTSARAKAQEREL